MRYQTTNSTAALCRTAQGRLLLAVYHTLMALAASRRSGSQHCEAADMRAILVQYCHNCIANNCSASNRYGFNIK
jgi:hypothetical protein